MNTIKKLLISYKEYIISIIIALAIGGLSTLFSQSGMEDFMALDQPPLSPHAVLFPIVWSILYILMGISAARVYRKRKVNESEATTLLTTYAISLVFNFFWSIIFFSLKNYLFAFFWLIALWLLILLTYLGYKKIDKAAAYLQIPYLLWVAFAGYLNLGIYLIN